jgi:type II secretory pathway pseudopilin PulG
VRDRARARLTGAGTTRARSAGYTYLAVLLLVAVMGLGLAAASTLVATAMQREQELELLFVGNQYRQAIGSYYEATPGAVKQFPATLAALLRDERQPVTTRHLRKLYNDPMTGKPDWVLVTRADGRIAGVASRSPKRALKTDNFAHPADRDFRGSVTLNEWKFVYAPAAPPAPAAGLSPFPGLAPGAAAPAAGPGAAPVFGSPAAPASPQAPGIDPDPRLRR